MENVFAIPMCMTTFERYFATNFHTRTNFKSQPVKGCTNEAFKHEK